MKKQTRRARAKHGPHPIATPGRSVFYDLFPAVEARQLEIRATLLDGLARWLEESGRTSAAAARILKVTPTQLRELRRNGINSFSVDQLVRWAARAGLSPRIELASW